ncbi:protein shisa-4-like isoform X1 [Dreissena polymorpha]|uniref:Uncharacterized protein n=1 Tax=Dreissena polymorpha TaxID=45954 RepID=A0A9D4S774_DREPO|nr:protein shisa-4-like isoform X1 [Dreissena polymorpha]KAH3893160.1 hypothetical protein DPMN_017304 [Dreissena polymorpha]
MCAILCLIFLSGLAASQASSVGSSAGSATGKTCNYVDRYGSLVNLNCGNSDCCGNDKYRYCCTKGSVSLPLAPRLNVQNTDDCNDIDVICLLHTSGQVGTIVGGVLGVLFLLLLVVALFACCFCASCPLYQYRREMQARDVLIPATRESLKGQINYSTIAEPVPSYILKRPLEGYMVQPGAPELPPQAQQPPQDQLPTQPPPYKA